MISYRERVASYRRGNVGVVKELYFFSRVPPSRQKLRLGFPPRELVAPSDPAAPVALANGDKVSLEILPAPPSPAPPTNDVGVATQHQDHTQPSNSGMKDNADSKLVNSLGSFNGCCPLLGGLSLIIEN